MGDLGRAQALFQRGALDEAEQHCREILGRDPRQPQALYLLARIAQKRGDARTAEDFTSQALAIAPDQPELLRLHAALLLGRSDFAGAAASLKKALSANPNDKAALNNLGIACLGLRDFTAARQALTAAIELDPGLAPALYNLGNVARESGAASEAAGWYRRALAADGNHADAAYALMEQLHRMADLPAIAALAPLVDRLNAERLARPGISVEPALLNVLRHDYPAENARIARRHSELIAGSVGRQTLQRRSKPRHGDIIRLGYLTSDIGRHATTHLCAALFSLHDRRRFRVHVYSYGPDDGSEERAKVIAEADEFTDLAKTETTAAAQRIADDGIDILVDLKGHTGGNRLAIAALRPAPVQMHWLGFPGTIGAEFIDYLIADRIVLPDEHLAHYREHIIRLPHSYQLTDNRQRFAAASDRQKAGLPAKGFVFACFNQLQKFDGVIFSLWLDLLRALPGSVLWLLRGNAEGEANLKALAAAQGIEPQRLIFAPPLDRPAHFARLALADLALDTRLYNGHTTTSDALWQGLPVLTLIGRHFASRVSASLLNAAGLAELIVEDLDSYRSLALDLARDPDRLAAIRRRCAENRDRSPLFATEKFVRHLETAYATAWQRHQAGLLPARFDVSA